MRPAVQPYIRTYRLVRRALVVNGKKEAPAGRLLQDRCDRAKFSQLNALAIVDKTLRVPGQAVKPTACPAFCADNKMPHAFRHASQVALRTLPDAAMPAR